MGMAGTGKSTFINHLPVEDVEIGHQLESCTDKVAIYRAKMPDGSRVFLMDTPGFDDTYKSDTLILREVASSLNEVYKKKLLLSGISYLHRIQDVRFTGVAMKNLRMFKNLCGTDGLSNVILTTTLWSGVTEEEGCGREKQLREQDEFWKPMIDKGSEIFRHDNEEKSARLIVDHLVSKKHRITLAIQHEMGEENLSLEQTAAGKEIEAEMEKLKAEWAKEREILKLEMKDALAARDMEAQKDIKREKKEIEKKMRESDEKLKGFKVTNEELAAQLKRQRRELRKLSPLVSREEKRQNRFYRLYIPLYKRWDDGVYESGSEASDIVYVYDSDESVDSNPRNRATVRSKGPTKAGVRLGAFVKKLGIGQSSRRRSSSVNSISSRSFSSIEERAWKGKIGPVDAPKRLYF